MFKKIKAKLFRFCHCLDAILKLNVGRRETTESVVYYIRVLGHGVPIWKEDCFIGCECGKVFYKKEGYKNIFF